MSNHQHSRRRGQSHVSQQQHHHRHTMRRSVHREKDHFKHLKHHRQKRSKIPQPPPLKNVTSSGCYTNRREVDDELFEKMVKEQYDHGITNGTFYRLGAGLVAWVQQQEEEQQQEHEPQQEHEEEEQEQQEEQKQKEEEQEQITPHRHTYTFTYPYYTHS
ncbi:hypothetical protein BDC45DRAFT_596844 [Circinella umbellata]|nr:hypothetical protein BDC45DRAFT_596844 [Circinella umbellata]